VYTAIKKKLKEYTKRLIDEAGDGGGYIKRRNKIIWLGDRSETYENNWEKLH
jgi:hypothetical protein